MMARWMKLIAALAPVLLLTSCLLTPGKFISTLDIRADRTFTFTYRGELIATDFANSIPNFNDDDKSGEGSGSVEGKEPAKDEAPATSKSSAYLKDIAYKKPVKAKGGKALSPKEQENETKMLAIADALSKEKGFRSAKYIGNNKFEIDYSITSHLDHSFLFPYNIEAQAVFPFVVIEPRADGKVRVQAPGFTGGAGKSGGMEALGQSSGSDGIGKTMDGVFILTTNAEIISQNQEDGATDTPRGKQVAWQISPLTKTAPMAVLRFPDTAKQP